MARIKLVDYPPDKEDSSSTKNHSPRKSNSPRKTNSPKTPYSEQPVPVNAPQSSNEAPVC